MDLPETFRADVAYIADGGVVFQVLLPDESDWDEAATSAAYAAWLAER
jgi:hypothetical protein